MTNPDAALLVLADGTVFRGRSIGATGAAVGAPFGLTHDPALLRTYRLGTTRGEVIAAWTTSGGFRTTALAPGRIGLARLAP